MDWSGPVIDYCERHDNGFWSEPLNASTNLAFLLAAAAAFALWRRRQRADNPALALIFSRDNRSWSGKLHFPHGRDTRHRPDGRRSDRGFHYGYFLLSLHRFSVSGL